MLMALLGNLPRPDESTKIKAREIRETRIQKILREDDEILELLSIITSSGILED